MLAKKIHFSWKIWITGCRFFWPIWQNCRYISFFIVSLTSNSIKYCFHFYFNIKNLPWFPSILRSSGLSINTLFKKLSNYGLSGLTIAWLFKTLFQYILENLLNIIDSFSYKLNRFVLVYPWFEIDHLSKNEKHIFHIF